MKLLKNKKFQEFLLGIDKNLQKDRKQVDPALSQDDDVIKAYDRMVMGKSNQVNLMNSTAKSFQSGSTAIGRSKDDIFDDFLSDLFTSKLNITNSVQKSFFHSENN
jgi:hypothetical protein